MPVEHYLPHGNGKVRMSWGRKFGHLLQSAPRELKSFNLVGQNFRTGRKWAPRELRIFNLVGQSFWPGLFSKVSADSHFGFKWNWPDALTPCLRVLTIFSLFLTISAGDDPFTGTSALEMP